MHIERSSNQMIGHGTNSDNNLFVLLEIKTARIEVCASEILKIKMAACAVQALKASFTWNGCFKVKRPLIREKIMEEEGEDSIVKDCLRFEYLIY